MLKTRPWHALVCVLLVSLGTVPPSQAGRHTNAAIANCVMQDSVTLPQHVFETTFQTLFDHRVLRHMMVKHDITTPLVLWQQYADPGAEVMGAASVLQMMTELAELEASPTRAALARATVWSALHCVAR